MKLLRNILIVSAISGLISFTLVELIFFVVFPSGWIFFLIPVIMGYSIDKFVKISHEELADEEAFEKLRTRTGIICAVFVLLTVLISTIPIVLIGGIATLLVNIVFYAVCVLAVYAGYSRGVGVITDKYYDLDKG